MPAKLNKKLILGVDIGGSKINMVLWDGKKIIGKWRTKEVSIAKLKEGLSHFQISRVGIGVAGILDYQSGKILNSPNLKFLQGLKLKKFLRRRVRFDNDVKCFLRAEALLGAAKNYHQVLAIAIGTGIGGGIITKSGQLYRGAHYSEGEFGNMILDQGKTWEKLYQASRSRPAYQKKLHAQALANLTNIFDPELIVLGGGGALRPDKKMLNRLIASPLAKNPRIVPAKLGADAVAVGAALLWQEKNNISKHNI